MLTMKRLMIEPQMRGLKFVDGELKALLGPGSHWLLQWGGNLRVDLVSMATGEFVAANAEFLMRSYADVLGAHVAQIDIGSSEIGLVFREGRLVAMLPPNARKFFWRAPWQIEVKRQVISDDFRMDAALVATLIQPQSAKLLAEMASALVLKEVPESGVGLLIVNGRVEEVLKPGLHGFWKLGRMLSVELVDARLQAFDVQGQEILSKDKVSLRLNVAASFRVDDVLRMRAAVVDWKDAVYRELQFGLRQAVGTRTLDVMLANKGELDEDILGYAAPRLAAIGIELINAGVKDIILPGEMKTLLNQVVEAEKQAQANLIKRREETAATRNLLNTAKLLEDNPVLLRLKELETLEKVTEKVGSLTVFGGLEGVMKQLVTLK